MARIERDAMKNSATRPWVFGSKPALTAAEFDRVWAALAGDAPAAHFSRDEWVDACITAKAAA